MSTAPLPYAPRAPFSQWKVQHHDAQLGFSAWFTTPGVLVTQIHVARADLALSEALGGVVDCCVRAALPQTTELGGTLVVHDWRMLTSVDNDARESYTARMGRLPRGHVRAALVAIAPQHPLVRAAIHFATMILPFRSGHRTTVVEDTEGLLAVMSEQGALAPRPDATFPGGSGLSRTA